MKRNEFIKLLHNNGFSSINRFAKACGMDAPNVYSNLSDRCSLGINRAFLYANTLGVPVDRILEIFLPDQMEANRTSYMRNSKQSPV